jgi:hypothetical protein
LYKKIKFCRFCRSKHLIDVINLGKQHLTGIFPKRKNARITKGPLIVTFCKDCHLLQLRHSYNLDQLYGDNYGYRSSLNKSMANHLKKKFIYLKKKYHLKTSDLIIDIGSNDGTFLNFFLNFKNLIGIDPTIKKFSRYYKNNIKKLPHFFSYEILKKNYIFKKAKLITSISMFYDLEDPIKFVLDIKNSLDKDGVWHFEQSYMPSMIKEYSYDTICHEHLEYYSLTMICKILKKCNLRILDVQLNEINGGSFSVTASHENSRYKSNSRIIKKLINEEKILGFDKIEVYKKFNNKIKKHKKDLFQLLCNLKSKNKKIFGYGASTKGNVILQYCGIDSKLVKNIYEVNEDKFNKYTPGTKIKILSDKQISKKNCDFLLVLPWHFKDFILKKEKTIIKQGIKFIFPLPRIEIV